QLRPSFFFHSLASHPYLHSFLHDALPISFADHAQRSSNHSTYERAKVESGSPSTTVSASSGVAGTFFRRGVPRIMRRCSFSRLRSEEHTSELQSRFDLVCRLLLEKKKIKQ